MIGIILEGFYGVGGWAIQGTTDQSMNNIAVSSTLSHTPSRVDQHHRGEAVNVIAILKAINLAVNNQLIYTNT